MNRIIVFFLFFLLNGALFCLFKIILESKAETTFDNIYISLRVLFFANILHDKFGNYFFNRWNFNVYQIFYWEKLYMLISLIFCFNSIEYYIYKNDPCYSFVSMNITMIVMFYIFPDMNLIIYNILALFIFIKPFYNIYNVVLVAFSFILLLFHYEEFVYIDFVTGVYNRPVIYADNQNVHSSYVENCVIDAIKHLKKNNHKYKNVKIHKYFSQRKYKFDKIKDSRFKISEHDAAQFVLNYLIHNNHDLGILRETFKINKKEKLCRTGTITHIINSLSGIHPDIKIDISEREYIGGIFAKFREQNKSKEELLNELKSKKISDALIKEWIEHY